MIYGAVILAFVATLFGVEIFRRWSIRRRLLDVPNERSSHVIPTPRGGGVIVVLVIVVFSLLTAVTVSGSTGLVPYLGAAVLIAVVSFIDDIRPLSPLIRFPAHVAAAVFAAVWSGGFSHVWLPGSGTIETGILAVPLAVMWIVWLTNAFNFMDGIDGIAATQSIIAAAGWIFVGLLASATDAVVLAVFIAAANAGFIVFNWPPARIFMGDVGSATLGFLFAVLPLIANERKLPWGSLLPLVAAAFVWPFLFDTVVTFLRRLLRGERVWEAHREHLYQRLIRHGRSHFQVTFAYSSLATFSTIAGVVSCFYGPVMGWPLAACMLLIFFVVVTLTVWEERRDK